MAGAVLLVGLALAWRGPSDAAGAGREASACGVLWELDGAVAAGDLSDVSTGCFRAADMGWVGRVARVTMSGKWVGWRPFAAILGVLCLIPLGGNVGVGGVGEVGLGR